MWLQQGIIPSIDSASGSVSQQQGEGADGEGALSMYWPWSKVEKPSPTLSAERQGLLPNMSMVFLRILVIPHVFALHFASEGSKVSEARCFF